MEFEKKALQSQIDLALVTIPRLQAEIEAIKAQQESASQAFSLSLASAAALIGMSTQEFSATVSSMNGDQPRWKTLRYFEMRAGAEGVVESMSATNGTWAEEAELVLSTVDMTKLRFRAKGRQSALGELKDGLKGSVVPPLGGGLKLEASMTGVVHFAVEAQPDDRTLDIVLTPKSLEPWARPGVAADLEITLDSKSKGELAIPVSCVIKDGLEKIYFLRNRDNPDEVIRKKGDDLGISDGRWIEVFSGVREGDEIVMGGVYELMLSGAGKAEGGHFHPDGSFHAHDH